MCVCTTCVHTICARTMCVHTISVHTMCVCTTCVCTISARTICVYYVCIIILFVHVLQTSQLSRFGRETHDFLTDLTIACQSIIIVRLIRYKCHVIHMLPCPGS